MKQKKTIELACVFSIATSFVVNIVVWNWGWYIVIESNRVSQFQTIIFTTNEELTIFSCCSFTSPWLLSGETGPPGLSSLSEKPQSMTVTVTVEVLNVGFLLGCRGGSWHFERGGGAQTKNMNQKYWKWGGKSQKYESELLKRGRHKSKFLNYKSTIQKENFLKRWGAPALQAPSLYPPLGSHS